MPGGAAFMAAENGPSVMAVGNDYLLPAVPAEEAAPLPFSFFMLL